MDGLAAFGLGLTPLVIPGAALLIAIRLVYGRRPGAAPDAIHSVLTIGGWLLILLALIGATLSVMGLVAIVIVMFAAAVVLGTLTNHLHSQRRSLLTVLALAAERGIPFPEAIRSLAAEQSGLAAQRASRLAEHLEWGMPLASALRASNSRLPASAELALDMCDAADLPAALRHATDETDRFELILRPAFERVVLLMASVLVAVAVMLFMLWFVVPVFISLYADYELELPASTQAIAGLSSLVRNHWWLVALLTMALIPLVTLAAFASVGLSPWNVPLFRRAWLSADLAGVLRMLSFAVRAGRPLTEVLAEMAERHPRKRFRSLLTRAHGRMIQGASWCDALRSQRLIRATDAAVLSAAERAGNLAWALDELAGAALRRAAYRLKAIQNIGFSLAVLAFGLLVGLFVVGMFEPLVRLIELMS
jgi:type IV pilus assembly protein PilC